MTLTCGKWMFYSWVPAGTCPTLTIFSHAYGAWITPHRCAEGNNAIDIFTIWYLNGYCFPATWRNLKACWGQWQEEQYWVEVAGLGEGNASVQTMNDKRKHSKTLLQTACVWKAHSSSSHLTQTNKSSCHETDIVAYWRLKFWELWKIILDPSDTLCTYLTWLVGPAVSWETVAGCCWSKCLSGCPLR